MREYHDAEQKVRTARIVSGALFAVFAIAIYAGGNVVLHPSPDLVLFMDCTPNIFAAAFALILIGGGNEPQQKT